MSDVATSAPPACDPFGCNESFDRCNECSVASDCDDFLFCTTDSCLSSGLCRNARRSGCIEP